MGYQPGDCIWLLLVCPTGLWFLCGYVWVNIPTQTPCGRLKWPCAITRLTAISTVKYIYAESITLLNANYQVGCQPGDCSHFYLPQGVCVDMLTHTYPHKPLGHIKWLYAITRLTAHLVWPDVWSGDLHLEYTPKAVVIDNHLPRQPLIIDRDIHLGLYCVCVRYLL